MAIGGNEDKAFAKTVLKSVVALVEGGAKIVEVIPTASTVPKSVSEDYVDAFSKLGVPDVRTMDIKERADAQREEYVERVKECDLIFFTGGDQLRITSLIGGSRLARAIKDHYYNGGVVAGTSAGAAAMSGTMIFEGDPEQSMRKGNVQMTPGLGLAKGCVIDTHFLARGRVSRLLEVVASNPGYIGLGLGEDTGIIIREGDFVEVIGTGIVVVVDGHQMRYNNLSDLKVREPIAVENIIIHTLVEGFAYDLTEQRYYQRGKKREEKP